MRSLKTVTLKWHCHQRFLFLTSRTLKAPARLWTIQVLAVLRSAVSLCPAPKAILWEFSQPSEDKVVRRWSHTVWHSKAYRTLKQYCQLQTSHSGALLVLLIRSISSMRERLLCCRMPNFRLCSYNWVIMTTQQSPVTRLRWCHQSLFTLITWSWLHFRLRLHFHRQLQIVRQLSRLLSSLSNVLMIPKWQHQTPSESTWSLLKGSR